MSLTQLDTDSAKLRVDCSPRIYFHDFCAVAERVSKLLFDNK